MKVKCKGEDGVELTWEVSPRPNRGGLIEGGEALFIAKPPPHIAPHRGGERGLKDGGGRTKSQLCSRLGRAHLWRSGYNILLIRQKNHTNFFYIFIYAYFYAYIYSYMRPTSDPPLDRH